MKKTILLSLLVLTGISARAQWSLTGNTGTNPTTNFIGTTDNKDLVFKTNNTEKMRLSSTGRLVFYNTTTAPTYVNNLYIGGGNETPSNNAGGVNWGNVAVGLGSMNANNLGNANAAVGFNSLSANSSGYGNSAIGGNSLMTNVTGNHNIGIGNNGGAGIKANNNVSIGTNTMWKDNNGSENVALGVLALANLISSSSDNTAIGYKAGSNFNTGNNNIFIGANVNASSPTVSNELKIGNWIIGNNGTIGIGQFTNVLPADGIATDGKKYKLFVKDGIKTEKVKVDIAVDNAWADYVFAKDYKLMSLKDIENYITTNGHLPEVPSTEEAIKNGIELKEMNILLLKKVEELTLHLIKQDKRIEELEAQNKK